MIPLQIRIQNFLSYGSPAQIIDFRPYKLICLSGKNGHGKSALLDAITWALWGSARKTNGTSKADQGVLRLGQTEMMVNLDFISNGHTYRVRRVFSTKYGKPSAHVDFGTYNPETDVFVPLTEKTIRRTQEVIDTVLGVDYEAFINSSFIRQGQSNEFSKKSPKDRKDVLAAILGLNRYEKARKLATDESKRLMTESDYAKKFAEHINQACTVIESEQAKLVTVETTLKEIELQQQSYLRSQQLLKDQKENFQKKYQELALVEAEYKRNLQDIQSMQERFYENTRQWKKHHGQLLHLPDKKNLEDAKNRIQQRLQEETTRAEKHLALRSQLVDLQNQEHLLKQTIEKEHIQAVQEKKVLLEKNKLELNQALEQEKILKKEIDQLHTHTMALQTAIQKIKDETPAHYLISDTSDLQKLFERYKSFYQKWIDAGNIINNELKHLHEKQTLLDDISNPSCPLCEQNVSQARKRFLIGKLSTQDQFLIHRFAKLKRLITWIKQVITDQHKALESSKKIDTHLQEQAKYQAVLEEKQEAAVKNQEFATQKQKSIQSVMEDITTKEAAALDTLKHNTSYQDIKNLQKTIESESAQLTPNQNVHNELKKELLLIEQQELEWLTVAQQEGLQVERRHMIHELCLSIKKRKKELAAQEQAVRAQERLKQEYAQLLEQEKTYTQESTAIDQNRSKMLQEKGALEHSLSKLAAQKKEQAEYEKKATELAGSAHEYADVAAAYGKDGLQALLIEDALPEIEQEANDLLSKLTDNQTHVFIESLRDLKKGGTKETLDINISDSNGIRPYEMFSGGEAFRIDFALRIAISKLLARRAGTSLQTLIIDEGFGSQDEDGLSRIMDVIYKIQDDFEKVIIVSHLTTMKDQFPVHFIIEKENQGSIVNIRELA